MEGFSPGTDGSTFERYPLAGAAACASIKYILNEGISEQAKEIGDYFVNALSIQNGINVEHRSALIRVEVEGVDTAKYACLEMLVGENRDLRVFMKAGHSGSGCAYTRISPPIGAMTYDLIDRALESTIIPVLQDARRVA